MDDDDSSVDLTLPPVVRKDPLTEQKYSTQDDLDLANTFTRFVDKDVNDPVHGCSNLLLQYSRLMCLTSM